jgi:hypothetical protein
VVWTAAVLCGGLVVVLLFFSTIGALDFNDAPWLGILAVAMALFFRVTLSASLAQSARGTPAGPTASGEAS